MDRDQSTGNDNGANRRAHARYNIDLPATVSLADGRDPRNARILDYCIGGLFLKVEGQDDDYLVMAATQIGRDSLMKVSFQAQASGGGGLQNFELGLRVCRLFLGGMGVAYDPSPDPGAILALQALAEASQQKQPAGGAVAGDHVPQALDAVHEHMQSWLKEHLNRLFKEASNELFIEARDATNNDIQNTAMDAMKNVDRVKPAVCEDVLKSYRQSMGQLFPQLASEDEYGGSKSEKQNGLDSELSLVDTGSFDDWVTVKNMMTRAEPKLRDPLYDLCRRFSTLTTATVDEMTNPVGLQMICMSFNEAMQNLGLQRPARNSIYLGFEKSLLAEFGKLYKDLNDKLVKFGVLPEVDRPKHGTAKRAPKRPDRPTPQASPLEHEQPESHGDSGMYQAYEDTSSQGYPTAPAPQGAPQGGYSNNAPYRAAGAPPGGAAISVGVPQSPGSPGYTAGPQQHQHPQQVQILP